MIRLIHKELVYDIEQQTWRIAHGRTEGNAELRDMAQPGLEQTDRDLLRRWIESGVSDLHILLGNKLLAPGSSEGFWTGWGEYDANDPEHQGDGDGETVVHDDALNRSVTEYDFTLGCKADEKALAMLMHRFVVRYVLWQWCRTFGFNDITASYKQEVDEIKADIEDSLFDIALPKKYHESKYNCCSCNHDDADNPEAEVVVEADGVDDGL